MNSRDYFKDIYSDFFGVESDNNDYQESTSMEVDSNKKMTLLFEKIDKLYVSDESRNLLKKVIEYMRKYKEKIEDNYINFNILLKVNNNIIRDEVCDILYEASKYFSYIDNDKRVNYSLYNKLIGNDYSSYGFITIDGISGINLEDDKNKKKYFYELEDFLKKGNKIVTVLSGSNEELDSFFLGNEKFEKYFDFEIAGINPDNLDIYEYVIDNTNISDDDRVNLLDYISKTYDKDMDYISYQNNLVKYISFNKEIPKLDEDKSIEDIFAELNELVGLDKVKKVLYDLVDVINLREKAGDNLKIKEMNMHMVFLGNPGTGKTTVARIIVDILYNLKYIKENKLVEVSVKDLVAEYVGQTAPKTMSVVEKSLNGVLFIDEAYTLAVKGDNSYNAEAIATLIQAMENYRDKLIVIFAGYTKEMRDFLDSNSGIVSRIGYTLEFDDYTTDELIKIFMGMMNKSGFIVDDEAIKYLEEIINKYRNVKNFGNARFVRNIYEKTIIKHASNTKNKKQKRILKTITRDDVSIDNLILE